MKPKALTIGWKTRIATKWQYIINPWASPWVRNDEMNNKNVLKGQHTINPWASPWVRKGSISSTQGIALGKKR